MPFGFWYIFQDDMIACEPPQVTKKYFFIMFVVNIFAGKSKMIHHSNCVYISVSTVRADLRSDLPNAC